MTAGHRPRAPIARRIGVEVIVEDQRWSVTRALEDSDDVGPALTLGVERDGKSHFAQLGADEGSCALFSSRGLVRIKRILCFRLAGRNEFTGQLEPGFFGDVIK